MRRKNRVFSLNAPTFWAIVKTWNSMICMCAVLAHRVQWSKLKNMYFSEKKKMEIIIISIHPWYAWLVPAFDMFCFSKNIPRFDKEKNHRRNGSP